MTILLVEDNPGDVRLTLEALKNWRHPPALRVASDGVQALEILAKADEGGDGRPDLILLDLNLPRLGGREVLREIKRSERLRQIPVIVLSTSDADDDVRSAYDLHANCYVVKPVYLDEYLDVLRSIEEFWFSRVRLDGLPSA
jgi:two-component system, chemotaxis family, response regulator Rcp1